MLYHVPVDIPPPRWRTDFCLSVCPLPVGHEPDIPDLLDYMQSSDVTKATHAAFYLQHLCYNDENVKNKVRYDRLGFVVMIVMMDVMIIIGSGKMMPDDVDTVDD